MRKVLTVLAVLILAPSIGWAREAAHGYCNQGGHAVVTQGLNSTNDAQESYPSCTVTVYAAGTTTLSTIYSDNSGTVKGNPFTADSDGWWYFYADNGRYDIHFSNGGIATPYTQGDYLLCDPADATGSFSCTGGGGAATPACTTSVQGSLATGVQTCAGEKTLQGVAGNPTAPTFIVYPPSDQQVQNSWMGPTYASFTNPDVSTLGDFLNAGNHVFTMLNGGAITGSNIHGFESALTIYSQDDTKGGFFGVLGQHNVCSSDDATAADTIANLQCIVSHTYNSSAANTSFMDSVSAFTHYSGTGTLSTMADFFGGTPVISSSFGKVSSFSGLYLEDNGGNQGQCGAVACYAWLASGAGQLDGSGNLVALAGSTSLYTALSNECFATGTNPTCGNNSFGKILATMPAGATTQMITVAPLYGYPSIQISEDATIGGNLGVTCNTTFDRNYAITAKNTGEIWARAVGNGGTGYAVSDTGTISGGSGGTYTVSSVSGGVVTGVTISAKGTGYAANPNSPVSTTASTGVGTGLTIYINQVGGDFTITSSTAPVTDPACLNIVVVN